MSFKLKSPFHAETAKGNLNKGGKSSSYVNQNPFTSLENIDTASAAGGEQTMSPEPSNETTEKQVKQAEEGMPLGLNPKQEAKFKTKKFKKGIRDDAKFNRQTEKAKNIYERNQFEAVGEDSAYVNPEKAAEIKVNQKDKAIDVQGMDNIMNDSNLSVDEKEKQINAVRSKSQFFNDKIIKAPTNMEGNIKPNRAGTPARMLKSTEDTTPMKYKSVKKAGKENLMSALAKKGQPEVNDFTRNFDSSTDIDLGENAVIKSIPEKVKKEEKKNKPTSGKVVAPRHSVKF